MLGFVGTGDLVVVGAVSTTAGIGAVVLGVRRFQRSWWVAAGGAAVSTWGLFALSRSLVEVVDGPDGYRSLSEVFDAALGSWMAVVLVGVVAAAVMVLIARLSARGSPGRNMVVATSAGAFVAMVILGLLDSSLTP